MVRQRNRRIHSGSGFFHFRILSDLKFQSWIFSKKRTLIFFLSWVFWHILFFGSHNSFIKQFTTQSPTFVSLTSPSPRVSQSTRLSMIHKSSSHSSLVHTSPIHASNVTVPVFRLVTARRSLLIYISTPLHVTNWQPVIWIVAPPFWITQYWTFPSHLLNLLLWVSAWLEYTLKTERHGMF